MDNKPFITVMLLCYNCKHMVGKALASLARQSLLDFELLFIDNGSTDGSISVFKQFASEHEEINCRSISIQINCGPSHGWNEGLKSARGEYVIFNDADDWMDKDCLRELAKKAKETGADRVTCQYREVTIDGRIIRDRKIANEKSKRLPTAMLQGTLFRKSVFINNDIHFPETGNLIAYDAEIVFRFASLEHNYGEVVNKTLYNYLVHGNSMIQNSLSAKNAIQYFECVTTPLVRTTATIVKECNDRLLAERMVYLVIRNYYPRILTLFQKLDYNSAIDISNQMHSIMESQLPNYRRNQFLKPVCNGYEQPGSFAVWILSILENRNLLYRFARIASNVLQETRFLR